MNNKFNLKNKVAIVTGSSGDIGISIVKSLVNANAKVYGFDKSRSNKIQSTNFKHLSCDLKDMAKFKSHCEKIFLDESRIDILINNAGITIPTIDNSDYSIDDWEKTICINLTTPFFCSQIIKNYMKENNRGSIINITSISAELGFPNNPAYGASKGGLKALSKSLASEYSKYGIRVNCIGPGYIGEGMTKQSYINNHIREQRQSMMMIKKWNTSIEIANTCIFLASNASEYITGQDIYVDGGWTAKGFPDFD